MRWVRGLASDRVTQGIGLFGILGFAVASGAAVFGLIGGKQFLFFLIVSLLVYTAALSVSTVGNLLRTRRDSRRSSTP